MVKRNVYWHVVCYSKPNDVDWAEQFFKTCASLKMPTVAVDLRDLLCIGAYGDDDTIARLELMVPYDIWFGQRYLLELLKQGTIVMWSNFSSNTLEGVINEIKSLEDGEIETYYGDREVPTAEE